MVVLQLIRGMVKKDDDLAWLFNTSGTIGRPKGAMHPPSGHRRVTLVQG